MTEGFTVSQRGVRIRLTEERSAHVTVEHAELRGMRRDVLATVATPDRILTGGAGELLAVREVESGKWLVVLYREGQHDGFTAFLTRRQRSLERRQPVWP